MHKITLGKVISDCITEGDGISVCPMRISFWIAFFAYIAGVNIVLGIDIWNTYHPSVPPLPMKFDLMSAAGGISAILGAGGAAIMLKGVNGNATTPPVTPDAK